MRRLAWTAVAGLLLLTACEATDEASGPAAARDVGAASDPFTALEWELIGTWTVTESGADATGVMGGADSATCDLADDHRMVCRDADGNDTFTGRWLADPAPIDAVMVTWVGDDGTVRGRTRMAVSGDTAVVSTHPHSTTLERVAALPRAAEPPPLVPSTLDTLLTGTWRVESIGPEAQAILGAVVGGACTLAPDGTYACASSDTPVRGRWWSRRALRAADGRGHEPALSLASSTGDVLATHLRFEGTDDVQLLAAGSRWLRITRLEDTA